MANCDNPGTGAAFERRVQEFFANRGLALEPNLAVLIGFGEARKPHKFDLGSAVPPVLVECKCHAWTEGGNSPSAKLTIWNEAMLYFSLVPPEYRKLLVAQKSVRGSTSLVQHYIERFGHLIPPGVELWEFDPVSGQCVPVPSP